MRRVDGQEALQAGVLSPAAGTRPVRLFSLEEAERFLAAYDMDAIYAVGMRASVNYVDPASLVRWIEGTLGDKELAARLQEIVATGKAYGFLVLDMKALLAERVAQCEEIFAPAATAQE